MLDKDSPVQGVATYLEFLGDYGRLQYVLTPHGFSEDGALLKPYLLHRQVPKDGSRTRWKRALLAIEPTPLAGADDYIEMGLERTAPMSVLMNRLVYGAWEQVGKPLFAEVSKKDLSDLRSGKSPTALMTRIEKVKAVAGYFEVEEVD
jgi:hypothetical protein